jgi:hypothetical protein
MANKVTVFYNSVRDIVFDVKDKSGREIKVKINGSGSLVRKPDGSIIPSVALPMAGAYGITPNVDAEVWAEVEKLYGSMAIFQKGYIKASTPKTEKADKEEISAKRNGEEPIKPKKKSKKSED